MTKHVGADKYERAADRSGERNGYRDRTSMSPSAASSYVCRGSGTVATTQRFDQVVDPSGTHALDVRLLDDSHQGPFTTASRLQQRWVVATVPDPRHT